MVSTVVKAKLGDLEEEIKEVFLRWMNYKLNWVVQGVTGDKKFLVRFQYFRKSILT